MDTICKNIFSDLVELSDLKIQRKLWLNQGNDTGLISSYAELMCRLFDDNCLEDFVEYRAIQLGLSLETIFELKKLIDLLNNYHEKESDDQIIHDPDWEKICDQAKIVVSDWVKHE